MRMYPVCVCSVSMCVLGLSLAAGMSQTESVADILVQI